MGKRLIQHKVKLSAVLGLRPTPECYFFLPHERGSALTGLKHFWSTNSSFGLLLVIQNVTHMTNSAVFSIRIAVFSEEYCMSTHANT